jgi:hypothetical protein
MFATVILSFNLHVWLEMHTPFLDPRGGTKSTRSGTMYVRPYTNVLPSRTISFLLPQTFPVGWEDPADGFRAHVFATPSNSTVVLSIKGTTINGPTSKKDKFNDNLLFSCCCARVDLSWVFRQVCGCYRRGWRCDNGCLTEALVEESLFYSVGVVYTFHWLGLRRCGLMSCLQNLITNLTSMYPTSNIWLVGHSLGGSLAALLGTTFGLPAVAFEAPGERLAATRLHLPLPPSSDAPTPSHALAPVTHVRNVVNISLVHALFTFGFIGVPQRRPDTPRHLHGYFLSLRGGRLRPRISLPPRTIHRLRHYW